MVLIPRVKLWLIPVCCIAIYVAIYIGLSVNGHYRIAMSGKLYPLGIPMMDIYRWEPYGVNHKVVHLIFLPCIAIDRKFWHKDVDIFNSDVPEEQPSD